MTLSERQRRLQRQAKSEQAQWEREVEQKRSTTHRLNWWLILVAVLGGGAAGYHWSWGGLVADQGGWSIVENLSGSLGLLIGSVAIGIPFCVLGAVFRRILNDSLAESMNHIKQAPGVVVDHRVVSRSLGDSGAQGTSLILEIDFEVDGQSYRALHQPTGMYSNVPGVLQRQQSKYPKGMEIDIAYDPADPTDNGIPRNRRLARIGALVASGLLYLGVGSLSCFVVILAGVLSPLI